MTHRGPVTLGIDGAAWRASFPRRVWTWARGGVVSPSYGRPALWEAVTGRLSPSRAAACIGCECVEQMAREFDEITRQSALRNVMP